MSTIYSGASSDELVRKVKSNLYEFFKLLSRCSTTEMLVKQSWIRWHTPVSHPWFKGMLCLNPTASLDADLVQKTISYFSAHNASGFTWWFNPDLPSQAWKSLLEPYGLCYDDNTPGMAVELASVNFNQESPRDFQIEPVLDLDKLKLWTKTFVKGYELPAETAPELYSLMKDLGFELPLRNYIGYWHGKPAATSNLFLSEGAAGVMFVATLPEARGQGIGTAMTLAPLRDAKALGYKIGILQSSGAGLNVYQRLGFRQVCRMEHYYWSGAPSAP